MQAIAANRLVVKTTRNKYLFLDPSDIERITTRSYMIGSSATCTNGDSKITYMYSIDKSRIATFQLLKEWEENLRPFHTFMKIRQSCIINCNHISSVDVSDNSMQVEMQSGEKIVVSRQLRPKVKIKLGLK